MNAISFDAINIFKDNIENMFLQLSDVIILHLSRKYEFDADEASKFIKNSFNLDNIKDDDVIDLDIQHDISEKNLQDIARDITKKKAHNIVENNAHDIAENNAVNIVENNAVNIAENNAHDIAEKKAHDNVEKKAHDIVEKKTDDIAEKKVDDITVKKTDDIEVNKNKKNKKNNKPNVLLPFCNKVFDDFCHAIRLNHGLYTQCTNPIKKDNLCTTCHKQTLKNDNNLPNYGIINERIDNPNWNFNGKSPVKYADILNKLNINIQDAIDESVLFGVVIPPEQLIPSTKDKKKSGRPKNSSVAINDDDNSSTKTKKKLGRPKKSSVAINDDDNSSTKTKKKPGRPKNNKKIVSTADDIIYNKFNHDMVHDVIESKNIEHDHNNDIKVLTINNIEYLKDKDNNIYIADTHLLIGKWNPISNSIIHSQHNSQDSIVSNYSQDEDDINNDFKVIEHSQSSEEDSSINTNIFIHDGNTYLKDDDNILYDYNTHDHIGKWNPETLSITHIQ